MANSATFKLGADTKDFLNGLKTAQKEITSTAKLGDELTKSLDVKYDPQKAVEAQKTLQIALKNSEEQAEKIRTKMKELELSGKVDTEDYRQLQIELAKVETNAIKVEKSLEKVGKAKFTEAAKNMEDFGKTVENVGKKVSVLSVASGGALVGAAKLAKDAVATGDDLATLADKYDMSTKAIQQWQYVAMQSDVSSDVLYKAAQKAQSAIGDQMTGATNSATAALEALGIRYENFDNNEQAFNAIIKEISNLETQAEMAAVAGDIFGERYATELIPLFKQGEEAVAEYIKEFEQVGYLSDETVEQLAALDNEVNKVTKQFELAKTELGVAMIPVYEALIGLLQDYVIPAIQTLAEWFDNLSPAQQNAIIMALGVIAVLGPMLILVGKVATGIGSIIKILPNLKEMLGKVHSSALRASVGLGAVFAGVSGLISVMTNWETMSGIQKFFGLLGSLTVIALGAAIAFGAFHSALTMGIAVAGIVAGIVAVTAAVNSAKNEIGTDIGDFDTPDVFSGGGKVPSDYYAGAAEELTRQSKNGYSSYNSADTTTIDESNNTYYITIEKNEYMDEDSLVNAVSRKISTLASARG